ncbi:MAG: PIN domain-containing protein [Nitrospinota bacterium]|nr:MAG: PIN domain-containing protein [Nitrospinota bacterium]
MKLFIDTWGWLTLRDKKESRHSEARNVYQGFRQRTGTAYTSDYVLDETVTLLFRRLPFSVAQESLEYIQQAVADGYLHLEQITPERFEKAKELRSRFQDKPRISFTDLTSMVIMMEYRITEILTEDDHFLQVGMGFQKVP